MSLLIAVVLVVLLVAFAFRGTNLAALIFDIILVVFLASVLKTCGV